MRILFSVLLSVFLPFTAFAFSCIATEYNEASKKAYAIFEVKENHAMLIEQKGAAVFEKDKKYRLKKAECPAVMHIKPLEIKGAYIVVYSPRPSIKDDGIILKDSGCCGQDEWQFFDSLEQAQKANAAHKD